MILQALFAAVYTFTATATGVEKGAPVEFLFVGKDSDRDYEALFILDQTLSDFCRALEATGVPRGLAQDPSRGRVWPVGTPLKLSPAIDELVDRTQLDASLRSNDIIYTGGVRTEKGTPLAESEMPCAAFSLYTLAQSPLLLNGIFEQGVVYNGNQARNKFEKGSRQTFTLTWDDRTRPQMLSVTLSAASASNEFARIRSAATHGEVVVSAAFAPELTVREASALAQALSVLDSTSVKINGAPENDFFFRSFLPAQRWSDRRQRLVQPYELHLVGGQPKLLKIEEDWSVEGNDPKITPHEIAFDALKPDDLIDTCLIYCSAEMKLEKIRPYLKRFPKRVINFYLFAE